MDKPLDSKARKKWYGYLTERNNDAEPISLTKNQIKKYVEGWTGQQIDPERKTLTPIIERASDKYILLKFKKSGKTRPVSYREIIDSEKIIRFWLAKGMTPESDKDFRNPDPAIQVEKISNNSYAPALAERIRKKLNANYKIPPEIRILPMSQNEFKDDNLHSISDVQEKFILGELLQEDRNGSYKYRNRTLNSPEGTVVLFQFRSHIIGSGIFLYSQEFDEPRGRYKGEIVFDVKSLRTFNPLNRESVKFIWPNFSNFSQATKKLDPSVYWEFVVSLKNVKFASILQIEKRVREDLLALEEEEKLLTEGGRKYKFSSFYERNPRLRTEAIKIHGVKCVVCGFDFEITYGQRGVGFIEVHHLKPISRLGQETNIDPKKDMTVLCSNCHRMIHRKKDEILTINQLKKLLKC
jgi:hypothetical protein